MSFYTALTGLNAATAQMGVTSNNIANVSTTGFKRSRTDFGDIFATSPLQKASATIGQGVALKKVTQEFGQGNLVFSSNTLDLAISGDGFFPLKSQDGFQDIFTRNGVFMMNDQNNVVNSAGQKLMAASVDSSGKANLDDMNVLTIPQKTTGMAMQTSKVSLGLNFPADAPVISKEFNRNDPTSYNKSTALTVYDAGGNSYLASVYYVKTQNASQATPNNKWQTYVYVGDKLVNASLQQATNSVGELMYVNKYGELKAKSDFKTPEEIAQLNSSFSKKTIKFSLDQLTDVRTSEPAAVTGGSAINLGTGSSDGLDLTSYSPLSKSDLLVKQGSSMAVFDMNQDVSADSYKLTFNTNLKNGPLPVTVDVKTVGTTAPTVADVVKQLNADPTFASAYVAQNTSTVTISGPTFATNRSTSDFSSFQMSLDGKTNSVTGLRPATSDLAGLAAELQDRLRSQDGGHANISVSVAPNGKDLKITDSAGRAVTGVALTTNPLLSAGSGASSGTTSITMGQLSVTALDPNVQDHEIVADMTVVKTVGGVATTLMGDGISTAYPRSTANYSLDSTASLYNAKFGPASSPITVSETTVTAFKDSLNNNTTFAASYHASVSNGILSITSINPADSAATIDSALDITQTVAGSPVTLTPVERTAAAYTLGAGPYSFTSGLIKANSDGTIRQNGTAASTETSTVTFANLAKGQSVTVGGLTFTATAANGATSAQLATLFGGLTDGAITSTATTTLGTFSGSLVGFSSAAPAAGTPTQVVFTSATANDDVTNLEVNGTTQAVKPSVITAEGTKAITENTTVTFKGLAAGGSITIGGLTYTSTNAASAQEVASVFANQLASASTPTNPSTGTFSGHLTGFNAGALTGNAVTFTSTTTGANQTDLAVTTSAVPSSQLQTASEFVAMLNDSSLFSSSFDAALVNGALKITSTDLSKTGLDVSGSVVITNALGAVAPASVTLAAGVPTDVSGSLKSADDLKNLFSINVDNSIDPVTVGLDRLVGSNLKLSGAQIAQELTNEINRAYGDEKPFNFSSTTGATFTLQLTPAGGGTAPAVLEIDLSHEGDSNYNMRPEDLVAAVQSKIDANPSYKGITASYDTQLQKLVFSPKGNDKITINSAPLAFAAPVVQGVNDSSVGFSLAPSISTGAYRPANDQRYGIKVEYDAVKGGFVFKSGTTGDASSISITNIRPNSLATQTSKGLGMTGDIANYSVAASKVEALRGISSTPAVLTGNAMGVNVDNNFSVDATNNQFVVSVNGVTGTVVVPPKDTYTLGTFMEALQSGINSLQSDSKNGLTPQTVDGVKVSYDTTKNALVFTTGTASTDSYVKVTGDAKWGLDGLDAKFGTTTTWIKPTPFKDTKGATVYIDGFGAESSTASGFDTLPAWSPVYFDKGELTFDTAGNLVSPKQGAQLDTVYLPNGKGALTINIDYAKSTQFASPFSVLSQSQDGAPEGDLVGLAIKDDGLVSASFSNGAQKSLGKVVLVNFSNPSGLRQIGDTNYYKTSDSGTPKYGEAGSAGFGTVRSGATERANVDLTQELVDLITEQRNFQANAKAMETSTSMTNTIIQIRN
jgi:flagellar hook-basal body protein